MANWCYNNLNITGDKEIIAPLIEKIKEIETSKTGLFESLVGIDDSGEGHMKDRLQLNVNGWGTKWDVLGHSINPSYDETCIELSFDTAWSPPVGFCQMLTKLYGVKCEIHYEEPGNDFCGMSIIEDGEITKEEDDTYREGKYKRDREGFWNEVNSDIECNIDDHQTGEDFFNNHYMNETYLTERDKNEIIDMFNDLKEDE